MSSRTKKQPARAVSAAAPSPAGRAYSSPARERQKDQTRDRILDAARSLFLKQGFDQTTIGSIAKEAGVAGPTVYAALGSKRGIVAELLTRARYSKAYAELVQEAMKEPDPERRIRYVARIARQVYDGERSEIDLLRGAGVVSPDLSDAELEKRRYAGQKKLIDYLQEHGRLRPGLSNTQARDILFAMSARDLYRQLVIERGWDSQQYQDWLAETLVSALFAKER
jgi:AcrR family transcriptional regulator